ncbi:MAG: Nif3-like dinuclear metal center hexameric protein [Spirochaetes bacterium]|nr:Nif3-like dinuclear metal center hexameric protein [Spirochaetota bacterium]
MKNYSLVQFAEKLEKKFPYCLAEKWDNVGIQIANDNVIVKRVLLTLDVSHGIIEYASKNNFNVIITHHPLIFRPFHNLRAFEDYTAYAIKELLRTNIALIALHTNLDKIYFHALSDIFPLKKIKPIERDLHNPDIGLGSYGQLETPLALKKVMEIIKDKLKIKHLRYVGELDRQVKVIGSCGGSGGSLITKDLVNKHIDVLLTSDIKYHTATLAEQMNIALIDAGHYHTEKVLLFLLEQNLKKIFLDSKILFECSHINTDPIYFY